MVENRKKTPATAADAPVIVGVTGASGTLLGIKVLTLLKEVGRPAHLIITPAAERTLAYETSLKVADIKKLAHTNHAYTDIGAPIASGSMETSGMIIAPCSIRTMSEIATGITGNLMSRAADVTLKERRKLVLMVRESPLHLGHLRTMASLTEMGATIAPPCPAFYAGSTTIEEAVMQMAARALSVLGVRAEALKVWGQDLKPTRPAKRK